MARQDLSPQIKPRDKKRPIEVEPEALEHAPDWFKLLSSCTRADPAKRPESAEQLVSRLREIENTQNAKQAEIAKQKAEAEQKRQAELAKQKAEEEAEQKRQAEIARRKAEEEQRQAELAKQKAETEDEQKRQAEIARRKAEEEQQRQAELAKQQAEAEEKRQAEIARRKAEQEQQRQAELAKQKAEAEEKRQAELAKRKAEQERQAKLANYRYIDNGDGTVTDNRTGLIWLKNANCFGRKDWKTAMQLAAKLADGQCGLSDGSKPGDWRLPTKDEWKAMVDTEYKRPVLSNAAGTGQWKEGDAFSGVQTSTSPSFH
jgi:hypothetical protein